MFAMPKKDDALMGKATLNSGNQDPKLSRRDFLSLAWKLSLALSALLGLDGIFHFLGFQAEPPRQTKFDLGPEKNFPPGSRTVIPEAGAILLHNLDGFTALSLLCPHLGCIVEEKAGGFACPCHGSRFDKDGALVRGPAPNSLKTLQLETTPEGNLILQTN